MTTSLEQTAVSITRPKVATFSIYSGFTLALIGFLITSWCVLAWIAVYNMTEWAAARREIHHFVLFGWTVGTMFGLLMVAVGLLLIGYGKLHTTLHKLEAFLTN